MEESLQQASRQFSSAGEAVVERVRARPYATLGLGVMAGYVLGGGFFSALTRPIARMALGALLVPGVRGRLRELSDEFRGARAAGNA